MTTNANDWANGTIAVIAFVLGILLPEIRSNKGRSMTTQSVASVIRQVLAIAAIVMGALTSVLSGIHLPVALSAVLAAGGLVLINIEHYLGDPSTGNPVSTTTTTTTLPTAAPVPVQALPAQFVPVPPAPGPQDVASVGVVSR
jgi:hypothetical protein